jgi:hypothetical protein
LSAEDHHHTREVQRTPEHHNSQARFDANALQRGASEQPGGKHGSADMDKLGFPNTKAPQVDSQDRSFKPSSRLSSSGQGKGDQRSTESKNAGDKTGGTVDFDKHGDIYAGQETNKAAKPQIDRSLSGGAELNPEKQSSDPKSVYDPKIAKYGVNVEKADGQYEYHLKEDKQDKVLFKTDASPEGLKQGEQKLHDMRQQKEDDLGSKYGVEFSHDGDSVKRGDRDIPMRDPRLQELAGVEAALRKVPDGQVRNNDGSPLKMNFSKENIISGAGAFVQTDGNGQRTMFVQPTYGLPATEKGSETSGTSYEGLLDHELGHNMQGRDQISDDKLAQGMGWQKGRFGYNLEDRNGNTYEPIRQAGEANAQGWLRTGKDGDFLDANGQPGKPEMISNQEMRERAKVRPSSDYFPNPKEEFAEGVANYRMGSGSRGDLLRNSPEVYDQIKQMDQAEIDKSYGAGKMLRLPSGEMAPKESANRQEVSDFEQRIIHSH